MADEEEEEQFEIIGQPIEPVLNEGAPFRIENDNKPIREEIFRKVVYLNFFAAKVFKDLPYGDKNHVICPINLFSSFCKSYN